MKKFILTSVLVCFISHLVAQSLTGDWYGTLQLQGDQKLATVLPIKSSGTGFIGTVDSPDQAASGLSVDVTTVGGPASISEAMKFGLKCTDKYLPDSNLFKGILDLVPGEKDHSDQARHPAARPGKVHLSAGRDQFPD